jgi:hypothetical protein
LGLVRHDAIVLGQPTAVAWSLNALRTLVETGFQSFWGQFGWMGVLMDPAAYGALWALAALVGCGTVAALLRLRSGDGREAAILASPALAYLALVGLGFVWYNLRFIQPQGRYLFSAMAGIGALFAAGLLSAFAARHARWIAFVPIMALAALDVVALTRYIIPQLAR